MTFIRTAGGAGTLPSLITNAKSGSWGSWGVWTSTSMQVSGHGQMAHLDGSSIILTGTAFGFPGIPGGSRFCQRSANNSWQTVGTDYNGDLFRASTELQFVHEMDCIPFDNESNPCLTTTLLRCTARGFSSERTPTRISISARMEALALSPAWTAG